MVEITNILNKFKELLKPPICEGTPSFPSENLIFRGQANESWGLLPKIFRDEYKQCELELIDNYKRRYNASDLDYLKCIIDMQHYGMPTKLLDWSENILVAIYFAVEDCSQNEDKNAKLFIMNSNDLVVNVNCFEEYKKLLDSLFVLPVEDQSVSINNVKQVLDVIVEKKYLFIDECIPSLDSVGLDSFLSAHLRFYSSLKSLDLEYKNILYSIFTKPLLIKPFNINSRIIAQRSLLTYHLGSMQDMKFNCFNTLKPFDLSQRFLNVDCNNRSNSNISTNIDMAYISIPSVAKKQIRYELDKYFNINIATIYPDSKEKVLSQYIVKNNVKNLEEERRSNDGYNLFISSIY